MTKENKLRKKMDEFFNNKIFIGKNLIWGYRTILFTHYVYGYNMITSVVFLPNYPLVRMTIFPDNHFIIDELTNYSKLRKIILTGVYSGSFDNTKLISVRKSTWLMKFKYDLENTYKIDHDIHNKALEVVENYKNNVEWLFNKYMPNEKVQEKMDNK